MTYDALSTKYHIISFTSSNVYIFDSQLYQMVTLLRIKFSRTGLTFQQDEKCLSLSIGTVSHFFLMETVTWHLLALSRSRTAGDARQGEKEGRSERARDSICIQY